jgi:hypothetical protein
MVLIQPELGQQKSTWLQLYNRDLLELGYIDQAKVGYAQLWYDDQG